MLSSCLNAAFPFFSVGQDEPSSLEVTWPDGRFISRTVMSRETNSVLEIPYPRDAEGSPSIVLPLEVRSTFASHLHIIWNGSLPVSPFRFQINFPFFNPCSLTAAAPKNLIWSWCRVCASQVLCCILMPVTNHNYVVCIRNTQGPESSKLRNICKSPNSILGAVNHWKINKGTCRLRIFLR